MPIYEYKCAACGCSHEILQKMSDAPLVECPDCHEPRLTKLVSAAGFRLSGSGWYETDFKTSNRRNLTTSNNAPPAETKTGVAKGNKTDKSSDKSGVKPTKKDQSTASSGSN